MSSAKPTSTALTGTTEMHTPHAAKRYLDAAFAALIIMLLLLAAGYIRSGSALNHDVAWLLVAAGRMLSGGTYSADYFEINMPLAILIYTPPAMLTRWLGISAFQAITVWLSALTVQCVALSARTRALGEGWAGLFMTGWLTAGLVFLPGYDFGQREHIAVLLFLPFLFLAVGENPTPGVTLRLYISLLAGIGFFLKPHFAGLPALLFVVRAWRDRSWRQFGSIEATVVLCVGIVNAAMVVVLFRDWFTCAKWARDLYGAYHSASLRDVLIVAGVPTFAGLSLLQGLMAWRVREFRLAAAPFLLASAYCWLAYLLQFKGWRYQFLPAAIILFASQGLAFRTVISAAWTVRNKAQIIFTGICAAGCLAAFSSMVLAMSGLPRVSQMPRSSIGQALSVAGKGDCVFAFTTTVAPVFPTVVIKDLQWGSRYSALWPLAGVLEQERTARNSANAALLAGYHQRIIASVTEDFERYRPDIVLVDQREGQFGIPPGYDLLAFFLPDSRFARQWRKYELLGQNSDYKIYARKSDTSLEN